uniref:Uncharacterized protein n=1 Tax=Anguilla anguilla TaxID=7936 RepID=A0A0E9SUR0_ANGAN
MAAPALSEGRASGLITSLVESAARCGTPPRNSSPRFSFSAAYSVIQKLFSSSQLISER